MTVKKILMLRDDALIMRRNNFALRKMMDYPIIAHIANSINIAILPIIIIPVTGLCCLVFYNRLAAINNLIHTINKDMINLHTLETKISEEHKKELISSFHLEHTKLTHRSDMVRTTIVCCFIGLIAFILSAVSIMVSLFFANAVIITLILWLIGALLFATGLLIGTLEVKNKSLNIITIESALMEKLLQEND